VEILVQPPDKAQTLTDPASGPPEEPRDGFLRHAFRAVKVLDQQRFFVERGRAPAAIQRQHHGLGLLQVPVLDHGRHPIGPLCLQARQTLEAIDELEILSARHDGDGLAQTAIP
jgi:hypothetical protein